MSSIFNILSRHNILSYLQYGQVRFFSKFNFSSLSRYLQKKCDVKVKMGSKLENQKLGHGPLFNRFDFAKYLLQTVKNYFEQS